MNPVRVSRRAGRRAAHARGELSRSDLAWILPDGGKLHPLMTPPQARNPLHGITLEMILNELVAYFGWPELAHQIPINCFASDPSVSSSLKFLRRTPWARAKVESLYLFMLREQKRAARPGPAQD
jgi:hypothetical protein